MQLGVYILGRIEPGYRAHWHVKYLCVKKRAAYEYRGLARFCVTVRLEHCTFVCLLLAKKGVERSQNADE